MFTLNLFLSIKTIKEEYEENINENINNTREMNENIDKNEQKERSDIINSFNQKSAEINMKTLKEIDKNASMMIRSYQQFSVTDEERILAIQLLDKGIYLCDTILQLAAFRGLGVYHSNLDDMVNWYTKENKESKTKKALATAGIEKKTDVAVTSNVAQNFAALTNTGTTKDNLKGYFNKEPLKSAYLYREKFIYWKSVLENKESNYDSNSDANDSKNKRVGMLENKLKSNTMNLAGLITGKTKTKNNDDDDDDDEEVDDIDDNIISEDSFFKWVGVDVQLQEVKSYQERSFVLQTLLFRSFKPHRKLKPLYDELARTAPSFKNIDIKLKPYIIALLKIHKKYLHNIFDTGINLCNTPIATEDVDEPKNQVFMKKWKIGSIEGTGDKIEFINACKTHCTTDYEPPTMKSLVTPEIYKKAVKAGNINKMDNKNKDELIKQYQINFKKYVSGPNSCKLIRPISLMYPDQINNPTSNKEIITDSSGKKWGDGTLINAYGLERKRMNENTYKVPGAKEKYFSSKNPYVTEDKLINMVKTGQFDLYSPDKILKKITGTTQDTNLDKVKDVASSVDKALSADGNLSNFFS